jgi:hypothetical protein
LIYSSISEFFRRKIDHYKYNMVLYDKHHMWKTSLYVTIPRLFLIYSLTRKFFNTFSCHRIIWRTNREQVSMCFAIVMTYSCDAISINIVYKTFQLTSCRHRDSFSLPLLTKPPILPYWSPALNLPRNGHGRQAVAYIYDAVKFLPICGCSLFRFLTRDSFLRFLLQCCC